jgi:hypothetical protein
MDNETQLGLTRTDDPVIGTCYYIVCNRAGKALHQTSNASSNVGERVSVDNSPGFYHLWRLHGRSASALLSIKAQMQRDGHVLDLDVLGGSDLPGALIVLARPGTDQRWLLESSSNRGLYLIRSTYTGLYLRVLDKNSEGLFLVVQDKKDRADDWFFSQPVGITLSDLDPPSESPQPSFREVNVQVIETNAHALSTPSPASPISFRLVQ